MNVSAAKLRRKPTRNAERARSHAVRGGGMRPGGVWNTAEGRRERQKNLEKHHLGSGGLQPLDIPQNRQSFVWKSLDKNSPDLEKLGQMRGGRLDSAALAPFRELVLRAGNGADRHPKSSSRIEADGVAAGRPRGKFSVLQSLENTQNRKRISIQRESGPIGLGGVERPISARAPVPSRGRTPLLAVAENHPSVERRARWTLLG